MCDEHKHIGWQSTWLSLPTSINNLKVWDTVNVNWQSGKLKWFIRTKTEQIFRIAIPRK